MPGTRYHRAVAPLPERVGRESYCIVFMEAIAVTSSGISMKSSMLKFFHPLAMYRFGNGDNSVLQVPA